MKKFDTQPYIIFYNKRQNYDNITLNVINNIHEKPIEEEILREGLNPNIIDVHDIVNVSTKETCLNSNKYTKEKPSVKNISLNTEIDGKYF